MMVETMLETSQDFGAVMSNGGLPQWKRELLQRRAARSRPAPPAAPPPAPPARPALAEEDEELRYGPGIVKRLKSRYLSLALRDAPRRRPSVLRRAASLEHLLDERPPPAPRAPPRPASLAAAPVPAAPAPRRDFVKRARSVDALSRLEPRDELRPPPSPPPQPPQLPQPAQLVQPPQPPQLPQPPQPPLPSRPVVPRSARPPRRPTPLLRETERPPQDLVRSTLRKFEPTPTRRAAPAARVSAVPRALETPRTSTPEPCGRSPSPATADLSAIEEPDGEVLLKETKRVSRAALESIASAGSSVRYVFEAPRLGTHLPPVAATNSVLLSRARPSSSPRRVGVIRPMPAPTLGRAASSPAPLADEIVEKVLDGTPRPPSPSLPFEDVETATPTPSPTPTRVDRKDSPPSAVVEPFPRSPTETTEVDRREPSPEPERGFFRTEPKIEPVVNGFKEKERSPEIIVKSLPSRPWTTDVERTWNGNNEMKILKDVNGRKDEGPGLGGVGGLGRGRTRGRPRGEPPATSVVFNFSSRAAVPDYVENDGIVLRGSRRSQFKAGESGVVLLPGAVRPCDGAEPGDGEGDTDADGGAPPSPCRVRFVNDNVLINGRSSMPHKPDRDRIAKLKLQFDDSLTCTFEYPSETSLCEPEPAAVPAAPPALLDNTRIASESLSRYTPHNSLAESFQLGVTRRAPSPPPRPQEGGCAEEEADAGPWGGAGEAASWSEARASRTDLLF